MSYQVLKKIILSKDQLQAFQESKTHKDVISYIEKLNESVVGVKLTDACEASDVSFASGLSDSTQGSISCLFSGCNFSS